MNPSSTQLNGGKVLVTGATGLIGGALLARLLTDSTSQIVCLVRSTRGNPRDRLRERVGNMVDTHIDRLDLLDGDLSLPQCGLDDAKKSQLRDVETVFHCAACTSFIRDGECLATNVHGLSNLVELLRDSADKPLFVYFGSAAASGAHADKVLEEDGYVDPDSKHHVEYTRTKAMAERLLEQSRFGKVLILRPSMVIPDVNITTRVARESIWPVVLMRECSAVPVRGDAQFDTVPLSFVIDYTFKLLRASRAHSVYHLTAGPQHSPTWQQILGVAQPGGRRTLLLDPTEGAWKQARSTLTRREILYVRRFRHYLPFMNQNVTFDCTRLYNELDAPPASVFDVARYLPGLLDTVSVDQAVGQSFNE